MQFCSKVLDFAMSAVDQKNIFGNQRCGSRLPVCCLALLLVIFTFAGSEAAVMGSSDPAFSSIGSPSNSAALYLRFRKSEQADYNQRVVQPFIRFRKSLQQPDTSRLVHLRPLPYYYNPFGAKNAAVDGRNMNLDPVGCEDERRLFEYFIVAGLTDKAEELAPLVHESGNNVSEPVAPITDIAVIFPGLGERTPEGYECIATTPYGHPADLNHGSIRSHPAFLCFRRGYHKPPLMDLGILDEGRGEKPMPDATIIDRSPYGHSANVNNSSHGLYFTTRRSRTDAVPHQLVITHICVIIENKGKFPHTYYKIDKNLNKAMVGSAVYVCYKKSQSCCKRIAYKPEVLDCFPKIKDITESLAQNVPMFCLPMGALIESWSENRKEAEKLFSTCVLTDEKGTKYYVLELSNFAEEKNLDESKENYQEEKTTYHSFRRLLFFIYGASISGPHKIPIERYISHMMYEVPFPSPSRPRVLVQLGTDMISFESHDDSQIPLSGATFVDSLKNLGSENFILAMFLALLEQKILVHSLRPWLLTSVSETICALMFPFCWQCPYIPQCPLALAGVLHAPLPFIAGVDSRYFDLNDKPPPDVTCFDLDTATVSHSINRKSLKISMLPKKPLKRLRSSLENHFEAQSQIRKANWELLIREAFLRFMCSLMAGYSNHLRPILKAPREISATDTGALFNLDSFLRSRDKNSSDFYKRFSETQCFIRFIEERSFVSDKNAYNVFFDDCIEKVVQEKTLKTELKLLDYDIEASNRTVVVPPPEILSNRKSEISYTYECFPEVFNHDLFESLSSPVNTPHKSDGLKNWAIRTKQENRTSLAEAGKFVEESALSIKEQGEMLKLAFKVLSRMERSNIPFHDQV
uniref:Uncharacterized protein n=1 Tax=Ditylenchus dipsaci TaxID=166011 RepID=A0A915DBA8_9BILA